MYLYLVDLDLGLGLHWQRADSGGKAERDGNDPHSAGATEMDVFLKTMFGERDQRRKETNHAKVSCVIEQRKEGRKKIAEIECVTLGHGGMFISLCILSPRTRNREMIMVHAKIKKSLCPNQMLKISIVFGPDLKRHLKI